MQVQFFDNNFISICKLDGMGRILKPNKSLHILKLL